MRAIGIAIGLTFSLSLWMACILLAVKILQWWN